MELFFISSPIGLLQILIKENRLYSLARIQKTTFKAKAKSKIKKSNQEYLNFYPNISNLPFSRTNFLNESPNKNKNLQKNFQSSKQIKADSKSFLNNHLSYLAKDGSILKQQKKSALAKNISQQLNWYFEGKLTKFQIPIYNRGTDFQKKVWLALQDIPWGHTKKYSQIAKELKRPKAYRAVGNSCGKNPFLIVVPCHRVLSRSGLGGFALGLKTKKYLLNLEQKKGSKKR